MTTGGGRGQATVLSAGDYTDPARHQAERAAIFARHWLYCGHLSQLADDGDRLARTVAGYPLVLVNDRGVLRGFHNVCRHRGGPVAWEGEGRGPSLVCRYHGWSYGLDGTLRVARDFGDDAGTEGLALQAVRVDVWRNLLFANLDQAAPPLAEWIGTMAAECADFPMESFVAGPQSSHVLACNWKLYAENYQEGYHIPMVHPGLNRQVDARRYQVEVREGYCVHRAPTRDGSVTAGAWLWRFPGFALNLYPDGMSVESFHPAGPTSTVVEYAFSFAPGTPAAEVEAAVASSTAVLAEDARICEAVQRTMASGLYGGGVLSPRHEGGVRYVQELVQQALAGPASPDRGAPGAGGAPGGGK